MAENPKQAPSPNRANASRAIIWSVAAVIAGPVVLAMTLAACVPYADRAEARFVLRPAEACPR